jgi:hypothetical protein
MAEYFQHVKKNSDETNKVTNIRVHADVGLCTRSQSKYVLILNLNKFKCGNNLSSPIQIRYFMRKHIFSIE